MKVYPKENIKVGWESEKCIHAAFCAKGLPSVFKPKDRPWIQVEGASTQEITDQVAKCPSGALSIIQ
jgi:uncharacterized Fe-S cluster protein YjdI